MATAPPPPSAVIFTDYSSSAIVSMRLASCSRTRLHSSNGFAFFNHPSRSFALSLGTRVSAQVMDGKLVAKQIREEIGAEVSRMKDAIGVVPGLAAIQIGEKEYFSVFVRNTKKACESVGIKFFETKLPKDCADYELLDHISDYDHNLSIHGIFFTLPLPRHLNRANILNAISIQKDVDALHYTHPRKSRGRSLLFFPCMAKGFLELLHKYNINIEGKRAIMIIDDDDDDDDNDAVGIRFAHFLHLQGANISCVHYSLTNRQLIRQADIIISTLGRPNMIDDSWIKSNAVVIDAGINLVEDARSPHGYQLTGDVCYEEASKIASAITPVPGGVGPVMIAMLLSNTLEAAKRIHNFQ